MIHVNVAVYRALECRRVFADDMLDNRYHILHQNKKSLLIKNLVLINLSAYNIDIFIFQQP